MKFLYRCQFGVAYDVETFPEVFYVVATSADIAITKAVQRANKKFEPLRVEVDERNFHSIQKLCTDEELVL